MTWFRRMARPRATCEVKKASLPTGLWKKCDQCGSASMAGDVIARLNTCPECGFHFRWDARERLESFFDPESIEEIATGLRALDPLRFDVDEPYPERLAAAREKVGEEEAFLLVRGQFHGRPLVAGAFVFGFLGGSMGSVVGEKITRGFEIAMESACPIVIFSASGGARMQEGILSLMQMAKAASVIRRFREARVPYVSVLTDPTTGGVAASLSMLGDIIIAEPGALIGFAGPRVIEQTIRQKLPEGFQRSEFLLEHGMIDMIVARPELRDRIGKLLTILAP